MYGTSTTTAVVAQAAKGRSADVHLAFITLETELGWLALACRADVLYGLVFGYASGERAGKQLRRTLGETGGQLAGASEVISGSAGRRRPVPSRRDSTLDFGHDLADQLKRFAAGEPVDFSNVTIAENHLRPFARRVVAVCRRIPLGCTRTYGQLAADCGSPAAARAVGQVMATNRYPLVVPCHRVVSAGGRLGGFSSPQGLRMKRRLLQMEGHLPN